MIYKKKYRVGLGYKVNYKNTFNFNLSPNLVDCNSSSPLIELLYFKQIKKIVENIRCWIISGGFITLKCPNYDAFILKYIKYFLKIQIITINGTDSSLLSHSLEKPKLPLKIWSTIRGDLNGERWRKTFALIDKTLFEIGCQKVNKFKFHESDLKEISLIENRETINFYIEERMLVST